MSEPDQAASVALCRHCKQPIRAESVTWWHTATGLSQCEIYADPLPETISAEPQAGASR